MNEEFTRILRDEIELDKAALHPETSLENAGLDSLRIVELSISLSDQLGLQISEEDLQRVATLGELDRLVEQRRRSG